MSTMQATPRLTQFTRPDWTRPEEEPIMGDVHVPVRIVNAVDDAMHRRGLLPREKVRAVEVLALVDTGAVRSVVPASLLEELGVEVRDRRGVRYADGRSSNVGVAEPMLFQLLGRETFEDALVTGDEVLIGQTILEKEDLWVDCGQQRLVPNPDHPDRVINRI